MPSLPRSGGLGLPREENINRKGSYAVLCCCRFDARGTVLSMTFVKISEGG
jgi:hypothetical protein